MQAQGCITAPGRESQQKGVCAMIYANPGSAGSVVAFDKRYGNYIGGEFVAPVKGQYFDNVTPVTGEVS